MVENENMINLNGVYVYSEINSEGIYVATYDLRKLGQGKIEELRHKLEDLYAEVDKEYSLISTRMRSFHIKWVSHYEYGADKKKHKEEIPVLSFYVVPSRVLNMFKSARRIYYELLHRHTIKIPISSNRIGALHDEEGYHDSYVSNRNLYLLPVAKIPAFQEDFEQKIRRIYTNIHEMVRDFAYSDYIYKLNDILREYNLQEISPHMILRRQPVADYNISGANISMDTLMRLDPSIQEEIKAKTAKTVQRAVEGLQREIMPVLDAIRKGINAWVSGEGVAKRQEVIEEIDIMQDKLDAIEIGRIDALDAIKNLLTGNEPLPEDDATLIHKLADEVGGRVLSIGMESDTEEMKIAKSKKALKDIDARGLGIGL